MKKIFVFLFCFLTLFSVTPVFAAPEVSAKTSVLINGATGTVLYEKNAHTPMPMASTTKIMTAVLLLESVDLNQTIVVTEEMVRVEGSSMGLLAGDTVSYKALLAGLMLPSGNDAANTVAISLAGSVEAFAGWMNEKATELQMWDTHFVTPSGLDADEHYSTAYDMALLAAYAMRIPAFYEVVSSSNATVQFGNPPYKRTLYNHNKLLNLYDGVCGIKTGYTKRSGRCLVSAVKQEDEYLIAVTLNAPDDWNDHIALYEYGFSALQSRAVDAQLTDTLPVIGGTQPQVAIDTPPFSVGVTVQEADKITQQVCLPDFIYAPVQYGQIVGCMVYKIGDSVIAKKDIIAMQSVLPQELGQKSFLQKFFINFIKLWT